MAPLFSSAVAIMSPIPADSVEMSVNLAEHRNMEGHLPVPPPVTTATRPSTLKRSVEDMFSSVAAMNSGSEEAGFGDVHSPSGRLF